MRTAVFTVVFPGVEQYLPDFFHSLQVQSDQDFELFIVNDGYAALAGHDMQVGKRVRILDGTGTPALLRKTGIAWIGESGFDNVIFADADDWFDVNRVSVVRRVLIHERLVVNDLVIFGSGIVPYSLLQPRFPDKQEIRAKDLSRSNFMGLSNTAARLEAILDIAGRTPDWLIAFDWGLFAQCLLSDMQAIFTSETATHYRQHNANIAGLFHYDAGAILRGVKVKTQQYELLRSFSDWHQDMYLAYQALLDRLETDSVYLGGYIERLRERHSPNLVWWEQIRLESEF